MTAPVAIVIEMLIMIGLPLAAATFICRRWRVSPTVPLLAAGLYLAQLALNSTITRFALPHAFGQGMVTLCLSALTYGVFEETTRYLSFRVGPLRRRRDTGGALAAGIGHGGMESIVFALPYLMNSIMMALAPQLFPAGTVAELMNTNPLLFIGTGADRIPAMLGHLVFAIMIVLAYRQGRRLWFWMAMLAHVLLDLQMFVFTAVAPPAAWIPVWALIGVLALVIVVSVVRRGILDAHTADTAPTLPAVVGS